MRKTNHARQSGFSLIEIAIVLIIAGLALGSLLTVLGGQLELRKYTETQRQIRNASEAVVAFAMVNRRLPCPASVNSGGRESFCTAATGACGAEVIKPATSVGMDRGRCFAAANAGLVPGVTLGLPNLSISGAVMDAWARPLRYYATQVTNPLLPAPATNNPAVTLPGGVCGPGAATCYPYTQTSGIQNAYYTSGTPNAIGPTSLIFVCRSATGITATSCGVATNDVANPAFQVYSLGVNPGPAGLGADEAANVNNDPIFVWHDKAEPAAANGAFDDLFDWVSINQLIAKMQANGVLP